MGVAGVDRATAQRLLEIGNTLDEKDKKYGSSWAKIHTRWRKSKDARPTEDETLILQQLIAHASNMALATRTFFCLPPENEELRSRAFRKIYECACVQCGTT